MQLLSRPWLIAGCVAVPLVAVVVYFTARPDAEQQDQAVAPAIAKTVADAAPLVTKPTSLPTPTTATISDPVSTTAPVVRPVVPPVTRPVSMPVKTPSAASAPAAAPPPVPAPTPDWERARQPGDSGTTAEAMNQSAAQKSQNYDDQKWSVLRTYADAIRAANSRDQVITIEANIEADRYRTVDADFIARLSYLHSACGEKRDWDAYIYQQRSDDARNRSVERWIALALQPPQQQAAQGRQIAQNVQRYIQQDSRRAR